MEYNESHYRQRMIASLYSQESIEKMLWTENVEVRGIRRFLMNGCLDAVVVGLVRETYQDFGFMGAIQTFTRSEVLVIMDNYRKYVFRPVGNICKHEMIIIPQYIADVACTDEGAYLYLHEKLPRSGNHLMNSSNSIFYRADRERRNGWLCLTCERLE